MSGRVRSSSSSSLVPILFSAEMEGSHVGPAFIDIGREQEGIDKLIDTLLDFKPVKRKNSQVNSSSPGPRSSPLPVAKSIRGRGRPPKTRQSGASHSPSSVLVADDSASLPAVDLLIECVQKLSNQNKVLLNKVSELESLVRDLSQRKQEGVIAEDLSTSTRPQDSQVAVSSSILSSVVERVERIEDNLSSRLLICRGPSVSELISSLTESGITDLEKVKGQLCMKICGADITKISVQSIGVSIFGKNRASLKIECNNISVKRHLLEQVKIKKPRGIYVVEYLAPDKRKIYNSLFNLKKRYPAVIKFIYIRGGVIFGKIGEGTLKFESMLDIQAINLQRSPAAVPAAAAAVFPPPLRGPAAAAPPPPRVLGTVAASGLAGPRAAAVAAFRPDPADAAPASPPGPAAAAPPLLDPVSAAAAPPPSCLVGPVAAFNLTASAAAAVAAPPLHPLVLVDAAAAPSRWVDPVAAFGVTAPLLLLLLLLLLLFFRTRPLLFLLLCLALLWVV